MSKHLRRDGHWEALALPRAPSYVYGYSTNSNGQQFPASAKTSHRKSFYHVAKWFHSMRFPLRRRWNAQLVHISFIANPHLISYRPVINLYARRFSRTSGKFNNRKFASRWALFSPHQIIIRLHTFSFMQQFAFEIAGYVLVYVRIPARGKLERERERCERGKLRKMCTLTIA